MAACVLNSEIFGLSDSKKLTTKKREELTGKIVIKNKAYKATLKETANYEIWLLACNSYKMASGLTPYQATFSRPNLPKNITTSLNHSLIHSNKRGSQRAQILRA